MTDLGKSYVKLSHVEHVLKKYPTTILWELSLHSRKLVNDKFKVGGQEQAYIAKFYKKLNKFKYNKTSEHEVVYYKECKGEEAMNLAELMVLNKLKTNRDRFILPQEKDISFFTSIIDNSINFL